MTLRSGDLLYIPRGWLHGSATRSESSLHVTFQALPTILHTALVERVETALAESGTMDEALPLPGRPMPAEIVRSVRRVARLLEEWADQMEDREPKT